MRLTRLAGDCPDGNTCPAVFATGEGTVIVQGKRLDDGAMAMLRLGENEYAVEIPIDLLREAVR
ncbi:MAG: hypothetical protein AUI14_14775 [Actinobacteria bacterium 13_2_20CM_2_71_6]|nr:MAG: hypothetical protein AUI14_14775 [Actinobacteria bacterium 13_2_20CM_2_71_6]